MKILLICILAVLLHQFECRSLRDIGSDSEFEKKIAKQKIEECVYNKCRLKDEDIMDVCKGYDNCVRSTCLIEFNQSKYEDYVSCNLNCLDPFLIDLPKPKIDLMNSFYNCRLDCVQQEIVYLSEKEQKNSLDNSATDQMRLQAIFISISVFSALAIGVAIYIWCSIQHRRKRDQAATQQEIIVVPGNIHFQNVNEPNIENLKSRITDPDQIFVIDGSGILHKNQQIIPKFAFSQQSNIMVGTSIVEEGSKQAEVTTIIDMNQTIYNNNSSMAEFNNDFQNNLISNQNQSYLLRNNDSQQASISVIDSNSQQNQGSLSALDNINNNVNPNSNTENNISNNNNVNNNNNNNNNIINNNNNTLNNNNINNNQNNNNNNNNNSNQMQINQFNQSNILSENRSPFYQVRSEKIIPIHDIYITDMNFNLNKSTQLQKNLQQPTISKISLDNPNPQVSNQKDHKSPKKVLQPLQVLNSESNAEEKNDILLGNDLSQKQFYSKRPSKQGSKRPSKRGSILANLESRSSSKQQNRNSQPAPFFVFFSEAANQDNNKNDSEELESESEYEYEYETGNSDDSSETENDNNQPNQNNQNQSKTRNSKEFYNASITLDISAIKKCKHSSDNEEGNQDQQQQQEGQNNPIPADQITGEENNNETNGSNNKENVSIDETIIQVCSTSQNFGQSGFTLRQYSVEKIKQSDIFNESQKIMVNKNSSEESPNNFLSRSQFSPSNHQSKQSPRKIFIKECEDVSAQ